MPTTGQYSPEGTHSFWDAEICACAGNKALLFCQRPACLATGALCTHLPGEPDTGSVMENRTSAIRPDAAARCRFAGVNSAPHPLPVPSDPLSLACSTRDCGQQRGRRKDKPAQSPVSGCRAPLRRCPSLSFAANVTSTASPQQLTSVVCVHSFIFL